MRYETVDFSYTMVTYTKRRKRWQGDFRINGKKSFSFFLEKNKYILECKKEYAPLLNDALENKEFSQQMEQIGKSLRIIEEIRTRNITKVTVVQYKKEEREKIQFFIEEYPFDFLFIYHKEKEHFVIYAYPTITKENITIDVTHLFQDSIKTQVLNDKKVRLKRLF